MCIVNNSPKPRYPRPIHDDRACETGAKQQDPAGRDHQGYRSYDDEHENAPPSPELEVTEQVRTKTARQFPAKIEATNVAYP